jgi:NAD dependent epimerase/dehydratase family enzyme
MGLGGRLGDGNQWQSWIVIDDVVGAIHHLLTNEVSGPVNLTAPNPVTNATFTSTLGSVLGRPTFLPIPSFGPKLLLGSELAENLLFTGQRVVPAVLQGAGYQFAHPELESALRAILGK